MPTELVELFQHQLAQQAMLYNLTFMSGRKQSAELVSNFFLRMQGLLPVTTVLEIGAHEGTFSRAVKKTYPEKTVRAFEANPQVYAHFLLEGEFPRLGIDYRYGAIGNRNGTTQLHIYESIDGRDEPSDSRRQSILLRVPNDTDRHHNVCVPLARLDTLCAADPEDSRYALWVDAEGAGGQVLEGAEGIMERTLAVYMELESVPKFENQPLDHDILHYLLERDFVPLLRDFQFNHQYNVVFVKKKCLPLVEHEWHRYFQYALRTSLQDSFKLEVVPRQHTPVAPPPLPRVRFGNSAEFREALGALPLLRAPRVGLDAERTVVACHEDDLDEAINFYRQQSGKLPKFFVLPGRQGGEPASRNGITRHPFTELSPGMDIQLYFSQNPLPGKTFFPLLCLELQKAGINKFHIERYCTERFFRRDVRYTFTDQDWDTALNFTNILDDAESQYTYMAICRARLEAEPGYIPLAGYTQYFHPLVHAEPGDIVCEGGCSPVCEEGLPLNSSTLDIYEAMRGKGKIFGFEPVASTYEHLKNGFASCRGIQMENLALWSRPTVLRLKGEAASAFIEESPESGDCACTSVDAFFADKAAPTLIKLDVEGAEPEVIEGARHTITRHLPKLMLSIYHARRGPDWLTLPRMLLERDFPYTYYCGQHRPWYTESIVYARKKISNQ
ncbi:MAG: FkbM family methyltransferase [Desulfovibrio sp.]|nr:FkbM family methyltransferase [Desulfovibrio sp.]